MSEMFIYGLVCPIENKIMYVGKAKDTNFRFRQHIARSRNNSTSRKDKWLNELQKMNLLPSLTILETCPSVYGSERENYWIDHYRTLNPELKNSAPVSKITYTGNSTSHIKIRLAEIATEKGYTRTTLSDATKISYPTILLFWNATVKKVDLEILDRLCIFLQCKACDIIEFTQESHQ